MPPVLLLPLTVLAVGFGVVMVGTDCHLVGQGRPLAARIALTVSVSLTVGAAMVGVFAWAFAYGWGLA